MRIRRVYGILILFIVVIIALSTAGVYATWQYATIHSDAIEEVFSVGLNEFKWTGSEDLPSDTQGEDHAWLITNLVAGTDDSGSVIGLNNPNSEINEYIDDRLAGGWGWKRDYFGSMAVTGGSYMEQIFGTEAEGLSFIIRVISDYEYHIFTTSIDLGERGSANWLGTSNSKPGDPNVPIGQYIYAIYRTVLTRTSTREEWSIVETKRGKALSDWYDENRSNANVTQIPSFDATTWVEAEMGGAANTEQAIWTFVGDSPTAYATDDMPVVYYRITPETAGARTILTYNSKCTIKIYDKNANQIAVSSKGSDASGTETVSVTFTASANTLYYISITGDSSMNFTVS